VIRQLQIAVMFALSGCAAVSPERSFSDVEAIARERLQADVTWHKGPADPTDGNLRAPMPEGGLTVRQATQIALSNNPQIQGFYEEIGLAQADFVAAGLLPNPVLSATIRFPDRSPRGTNVEFDIIGNVLHILKRPARMRVSALAVDESVLRVSARLLAFAADVEAAFLRLQGALHEHGLLQRISETARETARLADRMREAGNLDALTHAREQALAEQAHVGVLRAELHVAEAESALRGLMGIGEDQLSLSITPRLPDLPANARVADIDGRVALTSRLDLDAAKQALERLGAVYGMNLDCRWLRSLEAGVSLERDADRQVVAGPSLNIELPTFDRGQADLARLAAELRRQQHHVAALALRILEEVRTAKARVVKHHEIVLRYRDTLIPLHERITELSQKQYDYKLLRAFDLMAARKEALRVSSEYIDALTRFWIAEAELRRALGGHTKLSVQGPMALSSE
jgi:cobalt-zinc-cadmium efflux system outer membrane protein